MKLKDYKTKHYKCDFCGSIEKHIDMYNDKYCYECIDIDTGKLKNNKNDLKVGDEILVEQAWEDETGNYHDEYAKIIEINKKGEMTLDFYDTTEEAREFIEDNTEPYLANDYTKL